MAPVSHVTTSTQDEDASRKSKAANCVTSFSPDASLLRAVSPIDDVPKEERHEQIPSASLYRSSWALFLVTAYSALAIFAWSILCILTYRPLTTEHYHSYHGRMHDVNLQSLYARNEGWLRAARVIQAILGVITIPLTTVVCARAAVVFTQRLHKRSDLSLRQTIALADRGWTSLEVYGHLVRGKIPKYGSSFLYIAIILNILGGVLSPLQSVFLKVSTTKTPTSPKVVTGISDILDLVGDAKHDSVPHGPDLNLISVLTRSAITTTSSTDPQARMWTQGQIGCNISSNAIWTDLPSSCTLGSVTLDNMTQLIDPFVAHLPAQFNIGLVQQFLPRMNSSAARDKIVVSEYPIKCESLPGAFYVHYSHDGMANNTNFAGNWSLSACMPANQTMSPWRATRDRQDITEHLYLNITINRFDYLGKVSAGLYRITLNSTLGYFELPNYANGQNPGPLCDKSPLDTCTWHPDTNLTTCVDNKQLPLPAGHYRRDFNNGTAKMSNSSVALQATTNKGPLLVISMALFGPNSFIANRVQHPEIFLVNYTNVDMWNEIDLGANGDLFYEYCVDQEPLTGLLIGSSSKDNTEDSGIYPGCIRGSNNQLDDLHRQIEHWIAAFTTGFPSDRIVNAFEAAAFLANEAWLIRGASYPSAFITYDLGADTEIPVISLAGIVLTSVLLCSYLAGLFAMAIYGSGKPVWTHELNAFAMMRIGAAMSDQVPFAFAKNVDRVRILDEASGWIGDGSGGQGPVGELALGASTPLTRARRVHCYEGEGCETTKAERSECPTG